MREFQSEMRRPSPVARYWPVALLLVAAAAVGYFTLKAPSGSEGPLSADIQPASASAGASSETDGAGATEVSAVDPSTVIPVTYRQAEEAGNADQYTWPDNCDFETGRLAIPHQYSPPCLAAPEAATGGATSRGVTEDKITVVWYSPSPTDMAAMSTLIDDPAQQKATAVGFRELFSSSFQLWGREVEVIQFTGTGLDEISARADAQYVAKEIGAFASLNGPSLAPAYADELAANGVLCFNCGLGVPDSTYQKAAPYMWGSLQTPEQFLVNLGDYVTERVVGRPAKYAGDESFRTRERTFGVIHFEQDPPVYTEVRERVIKEGAERGWEAELYLQYLFDIGSFPQQAKDIIAQLKAKEVTTVVFLGDFLMPSYLTRAATEQGYYPEWIITGTVLSDTSTFGRGYDQTQWKNAFGISSLPVPVGMENEGAYKLYEWFHGRPPEAARIVRALFEPMLQFYTGIHMAGPNLTPETFRAGMFNFPPSGGTPTVPQIGYGTDLFEEPDYQGYDDVVEIWWDPEATGIDEQGVEGKGMIQYANMGRRFRPGEMISDELSLFDRSTSVQSFDGIPEAEKTKDYPSPAGSN